MYKVKPYLLFETNKGTALQNNVATIFVTNTNMINFLVALEKDKTLVNSSSQIDAYFSGNSEKAIQFLLENKVIYEVTKPLFEFNEIHVISNSELFMDVFALFSKDMTYDVQVHNPDCCDTTFSFLNNKSLCIIFLNPFDLNKFEGFLDVICKYDCIIKPMFYYNHAIYMANYHRPSWKNPCPRCFFYSLEAQLRTGNYSSVTFQTLIDMLYIREVKFDLEAILSPHHLLGVMNVLFSQLNSVQSFNSFVSAVHDFKLESITVNMDYSYHWELCDCYE